MVGLECRLAYPEHQHFTVVAVGEHSKPDLTEVEDLAGEVLQE
jgi:hypothetical protein